MGSLDKLAFTWSPDPKQFTGKNVSFQFNDTKPFIKNMDKCCDYRLYPELTTNGNIHYHGVVFVKDKYKWFKSVLPSLKYHGFVLLKKDVNDNWEDKYCKKDVELMSKLLKIDLPIVPSVSSGRKLNHRIPVQFHIPI